LLGKGATASVYSGHRVHREERVAIKVIAPHLAQDPHVSGRFEAEARVLMRIDHPNVIRVLELGQLEDGTLYQVMELLEGRDLLEVMRYVGVFRPRQVLPYLRQICAGLQASHDQGVVHGDLKPNNIYVLEGQPMRLKLLDFGIAKQLCGDITRFTAAGVAVGTPQYMAPEQASGELDLISFRTDIYSLGVLLYAMLCGAPPYHNISPETLLRGRVLPPPERLEQSAPDVPLAVAEVVHLCLAPDPEARPARARDVPLLYEAALDSATVVDVTPPWFASGTDLEPTLERGLPAEFFSAPTALLQGQRGEETVVEKSRGARIATVIVLAVVAAVLMLAGVVGYLVATGGP
jgi:serine/threonine-protein kinase